MSLSQRVKKAAKILLILISTFSLSGCVAVPIVTTSVSAVSGYFSYKAATADKVEVTTIARECHLYQYVSIPIPERESLSDATKRVIAGNNKAMIENCPNIKKPD